MSADADLATSECEAIRQYADWCARQGYQVSVEPFGAGTVRISADAGAGYDRPAQWRKCRRRDKDFLFGEFRSNPEAR
jgi:hypothetical protein